MPELRCLICGRLMRPWDELPVADDTDCGGDCLGCVKELEDA